MRKLPVALLAAGLLAVPGPAVAAEPVADGFATGTPAGRPSPGSAGTR
ncbi:hypothetical protein [Actinoplanes sp. NPDC051494]